MSTCMIKQAATISLSELEALKDATVKHDNIDAIERVNIMIAECGYNEAT